MRERTSRAWTASRRTPASGPAAGCCAGCSNWSAIKGLFPRLTLGVALLFRQLVLLVAPERLHEVVDAAASRGKEICYAPGAQDQEHQEHQQDLEEAHAHRWRRASIRCLRLMRDLSPFLRAKRSTPTKRAARFRSLRLSRNSPVYETTQPFVSGETSTRPPPSIVEV